MTPAVRSPRAPLTRDDVDASRGEAVLVAARRVDAPAEIEPELPGSSPRIASRAHARHAHDTGARHPRLALAGLALVGCGLIGCGAPPTGVRAEPSTLVFSPAAERLELRLVNHGDAAAPLTRIRFDTRTPDWSAFTIEDREYPREIAAGGAVSLRLRVDADHFARRGGSPGSARLLFAAGDAPQTVELRYQPADLARDLRLAAIRTALLLGLVALAWALTRRTRPALAWTAWLPMISAVALLPIGPGLCPEALAQPLSAADLEQCAAGRGGVPLSLVAVGEGWLVYIVALVIAGLARLGDATPPGRRIASRDLALALAFAGPLLAFGTFDPRLLVGEQSVGLLGGAAIPPAWGILTQPIAAAIAIAVLAAPPAPRLERLGFAATFAACFLGGAAMPALSLAGTGHGVALLIGAVVLAVKIAAVTWAVQRLHAAASGSRARAAIVFLERVAIPLALVNLLLTSAYALLR